MAQAWLLGDERGRFPRLVAQFAALRGIRSSFLSSDAALGELPLGPRSLLALRLDRLLAAGGRTLAALERALGQGATVYVRGRPTPGSWVALAPFLGSGFAVCAQNAASSLRFTDHPLVPAALVGEQARVELAMAGAWELGPAYAPILLARDRGAERAAIFAHQYQQGMVIFDLNRDEQVSDAPIVFRLADAAQRSENVGALLAVDRAAGRDPRRATAFNLTLDDRPANYDYFNLAHLRGFLQRAQAHMPGVHVDFSWTPDQWHPSQRYVELLKAFGCGFLWHGFARHVRHDALEDPQGELAAGRRLVEHIESRYKVNFQPVMVFPFERGSEDCLAEAARCGFRAIALSLLACPEMFTDLPAYLSYSIVQRSHSAEGPLALRRQAIERFPSELMLAQAALGLPVLALAHPEDFSLKRFPRPWAADSMVELDRVLDFAQTKGLRPRSLEQIAAELGAAQAV